MFSVNVNVLMILANNHQKLKSGFILGYLSKIAKLKDGG